MKKKIEFTEEEMEWFLFQNLTSSLLAARCMDDDEDASITAKTLAKKLFKEFPGDKE